MSYRYSEGSFEFDELTDLPTMMYFRRYAGSYVGSAQRRGETTYLIYFNLENFSVFNERYGFEEGDRLLSLAAVAIQEAFPGYLLSRFSADHFFLVCESNDISRGIMEIHDQLHAFGRHANVKLKAGVYQIDAQAFDVGVACDRAKIACDSIAHRYDRTVRWYDEALSWRVERSQYIESHIDRAIKGGWIKVYFQPIVRTVTGEVCEFEALARWDDPRYGLLSPATFVDVLEKARLIHKLDEHMVMKVCEEWRRLSATEVNLVPVSINLSRLDFELCDAFELVESAVRKFDVPRPMLHVEVTESALNDSNELLARDIARFREAGYQVWLDDFGSGYSSLNTLKDFVFDVVKIDMVFLREFETKPKSRTIISSIVNMAKQLGMQTLIEGVETAEQFDFLRSIGCEFVQGYLVGKPMPIEENVRRINSGELVVGSTQLHGYYDRLGAINMLAAAPFDFPWEMDASARPTVDMLPLGIVEREGDAIRFVLANDVFEDVVRDIGLSGVSELGRIFNKPQGTQSHLVHELLNAALTSRRMETVDLLQNGYHCVLRARYVTSHGDVDSFLISLLSFSRYANVGEDKRLEIALRYLYSVYEEVNIVDMSDGMVSTLYRGNTSYPAVEKNVSMADAAYGFAQNYVHPDDRDRCIRHLDLSTLEQRIENSGRNCIADAFRTLQPDGTYEWLTSLLVPIVVDGENTVLVCVRKSNREVVGSIQQMDGVSKDLLWDTLLDLVPAGVFWKDADRRFLGVNKNFLDFYSFKSVNDVLGKTDEDMGWHVDVDPFMQNELRVIERAEPVLNSHGTCISQGEVRHIVASKIPLLRNGEVVGLLGYFTDRIDTSPEGHSLMFDGFDRMAETDHLTGIPNLRGLTSSAVAYQEVFEEGGPSYLYAVIDIHGMSAFNELYGRAFGNRILKVVAKRLTKACGVSAVVARVGGDKFAVLRQIVGNMDAEQEAMNLVSLVESVHEVDGIHMNLYCYYGWALAQEAGDASGVLSLADERMREQRRLGSASR